MIVNPFSYLIEKLKGKVDKSGDTMTGQLEVHRTGGNTPLSLKRTDDNTNIYIGFENQNNVLGYIGMNTSGKPIIYDTALNMDREIALKSDFQWKHIDTLNGNVQKDITDLLSSYNEFLIQVVVNIDGVDNAFTAIVPTNGPYFTVMGSARSNSMGNDVYTVATFPYGGMGRLLQVPYIVLNGTYLSSGYTVELYAR